MKAEIKIIGEDSYEYDLDEVVQIIVRNSLGKTFSFEVSEIKSISMVNKQENEE